MVKSAIRWVLFILGGLLLLATLLPLLPSDEWWVRIWGFPRAQIAVLLVMVLVAIAAAVRMKRATVAFLIILAAALVYQVSHIYPYTPLHVVEAVESRSCEAKSRIRLLVANVLIDNRQAQPLVDLVQRVQPDLVLLLETDQWWHRQLASLDSLYEYAVRQPQEDSYGMHLYSRLKLVDPTVQFLLEDYVPSIHTGIELRSGEFIDFYGVHPMPPPLDDTERRDAELLLVGRLARDAPHPAIVAGDLNDVAWSHTTRLFQETSTLLDPRIGRGLYPTFTADWPLLRWPLDHVFYGDRFTLLSMETMPDIGSDHFPFYIALCHRPENAPLQAEPAPEAEDLRDAGEAIEEGREEAREQE